MKTYNKGKRNEFRACNGQCASAFRCDRAHGLVYGPFRYTDGTFATDAEEYSRETDSCAYCGADAKPQTTPIRTAYVWRVFDWHDGQWRDCGTVQTWTPDKSLARLKACEGSPALRRGRFKVTTAGTTAVPDGMRLWHDRVYHGTESGIVADVYGEFAALLKLNHKPRETWQSFLGFVPTQVPGRNQRGIDRRSSP